jgi:hypothetical protein
MLPLKELRTLPGALKAALPEFIARQLATRRSLLLSLS